MEIEKGEFLIIIRLLINAKEIDILYLHLNMQHKFIFTMWLFYIHTDNCLEI